MSLLSIVIKISEQKLYLYREGLLIKTFSISTGKNGVGQRMGSYQTPLGHHEIYQKIGEGEPINMIFRARRPTGEIYSSEKHAGERLVLTRILWLTGLEPGKNQGGQVDTRRRYIYIHGTSDDQPIGMPASKGCICLRNHDMIELFGSVNVGTPVEIVL